ncbi:DUF4097 domain-containing protein [Solihabitans fulvus]|uniref:DUF4097 domain-containing protein n=1 Tax=Solihabitans fulvus TaxID=1892852 RepID=A0A5B2WC37_9PSEU|nr:DUF4097 family beta strand repeat-containing protein [Solihabitans fulvus]KAA2248438.1 DUF4097 domain-containing protein [Solihabitans fulvus]
MTATVAGLVVLGACGLLTTNRETFSDDSPVAEKIAAVRLDGLGSGSVRLRTQDGATGTTVHREVHYATNKPGVTQQVDGGDTLVLRGCGENNCSVDYDVVAPTGVKITGGVGSGSIELTKVAEADVRTSSGSVTARGVAGSVRVEVGSGSVTLSDVGGAATVKSSSGSVALDGVRGALAVQAGSGRIRGANLGGDQADVKTSSGEIDLGFTTMASVTAQTGSGDVTLTVPKGNYRVAVDTNSGNRSVDVVQDPAATHALTLHTSSGDVAVKAA